METQQNNDEEDWEDLSKFEVKITVKEKRSSLRLRTTSSPNLEVKSDQDNNTEHPRIAPILPPKPSRLRSPTIEKQPYNITELIIGNEESTPEETTTPVIKVDDEKIEEQPIIQLIQETIKTEEKPTEIEIQIPIKEETKILTLADINSNSLESFIPRFFGLKKQISELNEFQIRLELQNLFSLLEGKQSYRSLWSFDEKKVIKVQRKTRTWIAERRKKDRLWNAVFEILDTERTYVNSLELIIQKFMDPLHTDLKASGISKSDFDSLFSNIKDVYSCNRTQLLHPLSERLKTRGKGRHVTIGDAAPSMTPFYEEYIIALNNSMDCLNRLKARSSKFNNWLDNVQKDNSLNKLKLQDYLLNPIKRISSYPLLLKAVIQNCPPGDTDTKILLEKATGHMEKIAEIINTKKQEKETKEKISTIKLLGMKEDLDVPDIILCSSDGNYVCTIPLKNAFAKDVEDTTYIKNRINIDVEGRMYVLLFKNPLDKELFLKEMPKTSLLQISASNANERVILKEGTLNKQSKRKSWVKRYFVLEDGVAFYYNTVPPEPDARPKFLQLVEYSVSRYPEYLKPNSLQFASEMKSTILLSADSQTEQKEWLDEFKEAIARCKAKTTNY